MLGLVRSVDGNAEIVGLTFRERLELRTELAGVEPMIAPDRGGIGRAFKQDSPKVLRIVQGLDEEQISDLASGETITASGFEISPELVEVTYTVPEGYVAASFPAGSVYLTKDLDDELEFEGFVREFTRALQNLRKDAGLERGEKARIEIGSSTAEFFEPVLDRVAERVNADLVTGEGEPLTIKDRSFSAAIR